MSESQPPPWHHLPHSPGAFFGLPEGATRDQLKQAYSVLIRRFKPDKFPDEFKRIRAAFEQLDLALQSDDNRQKASAIEIPPVVITPSYQESPHRELSPRAAAYQRIQDNDPDKWYDELTHRPHKTQQDYYVLATLSEVLESGSKGFADWIAEGLIKYPRSQDLSDLLQAYFKKAPIGPEQASALLLRLAQVLPGASYYAITVALWHRYSSMVAWETFQGLLDSCERCLGIRQADDRKAFTVDLMRRVMWRAPLDWLREKRKWIEESVGSLPSDMEFDHEINCQLIVLRRWCRGQLQRGPYGQRILDAIVSFCEEGMEASQKVCACQVQIANHPREFLEEFRYQAEDQIGWVFAWQWISWAVSTTLTTQEQPIDPNQHLHFMASIKNRMDKGTPKIIFGGLAIRQFIGVALFCVLALLLTIVVFLPSSLLIIALSGISKNYSGMNKGNAETIFGLMFFALIIGTAISVLWAWKKLQVRWNTKIIEPYLKRCFSKEYRTKWRYSVAHSMQVLACPYQSYIGMVNHLCSYGDWIKNPSMRLASFLQSDLGLTLYCAAVSFAR
jgi:hypothetical protein